MMRPFKTSSKTVQIDFRTYIDVSVHLNLATLTSEVRSYIDNVEVKTGEDNVRRVRSDDEDEEVTHSWQLLIYSEARSGF